MSSIRQRYLEEKRSKIEKYIANTREGITQDEDSLEQKKTELEYWEIIQSGIEALLEVEDVAASK